MDEKSKDFGYAHKLILTENGAIVLMENFIHQEDFLNSLVYTIQDGCVLLGVGKNVIVLDASILAHLVEANSIIIYKNEVNEYIADETAIVVTLDKRALQEMMEEIQTAAKVAAG